MTVILWEFPRFDQTVRKSSTEQASTGKENGKFFKRSNKFSGTIYI
ncbi:MAG: hypothetical protein WBA74_08890 [Cyclobacteriaceae bacterium]